jgi:phospholipase C
MIAGDGPCAHSAAPMGRTGLMISRIRVRPALAAAAAVAVCGAVAFPLGAGQPSSAQPSPIQHVVVLDLENHSFDNVLGFWCQAATLPGGVTPRCGAGDAMPATVTLSNGAVVTPYAMPDVVPTAAHDVASQVAAIDGGRMDGWQNATGGTCAATTRPAYRCVGGYPPAQVPNITVLAGAGAMEDRFFEEQDAPSWGGHLYAVAATLDGFTGDNPVPPPGSPATGHPGWGCDSGLVTERTGGTMAPSCVPDFALNLPYGGAFEPTPALYVPTIMDRLNAAGLSWKIYGAANTSLPGKTPGNYSGYVWSVCPTFAECLHTQRAGLVDESHFFTDAGAGTLPAFSLITAGGVSIGAEDSCHNGFSMTACDNYVGQVASAVMNSPQWASTALLITWDDFGGFYDSQPPPGANPDGTAAGIRLPLIAVSPYAVPESTDSTPATFASILAFTEHVFGLPPLEQNDASAYDLSGLFTPGTVPGTSGPAVSHLGDRPRMVVRPVPKGDKIQWWEARQDT